MATHNSKKATSRIQVDEDIQLNSNSLNDNNTSSEKMNTKSNSCELVSIKVIDRLLDEKLKIFQTVVDELKQSNNILLNRISQVEEKCSKVTEELHSFKDSVKNEQTKVNKERAELVAKCIQQEEGNQILMKKLHALESYSRRDNLVISGLPYSSYSEATTASLPSSSSIQQNDDYRENDAATEAAVVDFCRGMLGVEISPNDISIAHRIPVRAQQQQRRNNNNRSSSAASGPAPVLIRFANRKVRDRVYKARLLLKSNGCRIYVNEHLTQETQKLLFEVRQKIASKQAFSCWTKNGSVFYKKSRDGQPIHLSDITEL